jgi:hypothetical protein
MVRLAALVGGFACLGPAAARAQGVIGTLTVAGTPGLLRVSSAVAGSEPASVSTTATYTVKATKANKPQKVTGQIDVAMPVGMTLTVTLSPTTGATSNGPVAMDAIARDLVGNITHLTAQTGTITYTLTATAAAGVLTGTRTVTLTITNWP